MAVTIEQINRYGQILNTYKFSSNRIHVGRAHDNDLVLSDEYVDGYHLLIDVDEFSNDIKVMDLGSQNGLSIIREKRKKESVLGASSLGSGNTLLLGKSYLRVYSDGHMVAPAKPLSSWETLASICSKPAVITVLFIFCVALLFVDHYLSRTGDDNYADFMIALIALVFAVVAYAGFWALIGKSLKHDGRFSLHVFIVLSVISFQMITIFLEPILSFNLGAQQWVANIELGINLVTGFFACYLAISLATRLGRTTKVFIASLIPLLLITSVISEWIDDDFSARPPYEKALIQPSLNYRAQTGSENFINMASKLYQQAED